MSTQPGMSGELADVFDTLSKMVWQLRYDWVTFGTLYGSKDRVDLLNELAPAYFGMDQGRFGDHLKLSIARLFDGAFTGSNTSNTNLTLYAVIDLMRQETVDSMFVTGIQERVDRQKTDLHPVIQERHKRLAHLDRVTALGNNAFGTFTRDQFTRALDELESIMDAVDAELRGVTTDFGAIRVQAGFDTTQFVRLLEAASMLDEKKRKELWKRYASRDNPTVTS